METRAGKLTRPAAFPAGTVGGADSCNVPLHRGFSLSAECAGALDSSQATDIMASIFKFGLLCIIVTCLTFVFFPIVVERQLDFAH